MNILWIPHSPWTKAYIVQRDMFLIRSLSERHQIHVISWTEPKAPSVAAFLDPRVHVRAVLSSVSTAGNITVHHVPRSCFHRFPPAWRINQKILRKTVRRIAKTHSIDSLVFGPSANLIGYPPKIPGIRTVFDYVDYLATEELQRYCQLADRTVSASRSLQRQASLIGKESFYVPNGVPLQQLRHASAETVHIENRLPDDAVVSWVGLTGARNLYLFEAFGRFLRKHPRARLLVIGEGALLARAKRMSRKVPAQVLFTGFIPPPKVYDFMKATTIGVYPGGSSTYFRSSCPIKILEFAAIGKSVVSSPVDEIDELKLGNVIQTNADSSSFAQGLEQATTLRPPIPSLGHLDWGILAKQFETILRG